MCQTAQTERCWLPALLLSCARYPGEEQRSVQSEYQHVLVNIDSRDVLACLACPHDICPPPPSCPATSKCLSLPPLPSAPQRFHHKATQSTSRASVENVFLFLVPRPIVRTMPPQIQRPTSSTPRASPITALESLLLPVPPDVAPGLHWPTAAFLSLRNMHIQHLVAPVFTF